MGARAARAHPGATLEVVRLPNRTPVIFIEIPGQGTEPVLLYGHLDKQPEFTGWAMAWGRGRRSCAAKSFTAAAAPTTATPSTAR
jgi:hypothetical protein